MKKQKQYSISSLHGNSLWIKECLVSEIISTDYESIPNDDKIFENESPYVYD